MTTAACFWQYEEHPERWVEGWTHILSSSRGQGRFFTDADNRAIMVCFNPGKSFDAKMQGSKTREALMKEDPRLAHFTDNEVRAKDLIASERLECRKNIANKPKKNPCRL